jgi:ATP-dependent helicase/nuclease subunit B
MLFEADFDAHGKFPPIIVKVGNDDVRIRGRIDRVDVLEDGYARVVDYKTGSERFSAPDAESGFQMQLMIYLRAVADRYHPAGVFYFKISEPHVEDDGGVDVATKIKSSMKLDGIAVDDPKVMGLLGGKAKSVPFDRFEALRQTVDGKIGELCGRLAAGLVEAEPKTAVRLTNAAGRPRKACDYCPYNGICNHY